jgi:hypothetical protein
VAFVYAHFSNENFALSYLIYYYYYYTTTTIITTTTMINTTIITINTTTTSTTTTTTTTTTTAVFLVVEGLNMVQYGNAGLFMRILCICFRARGWRNGWTMPSMF